MSAPVEAPIGAGDLLLHLRSLGCRIWLGDGFDRLVWCLATTPAALAAMRVHQEDIARNRERLILLLAAEEIGRN
jgi:hypothetical protein